jgi:hypothetical protein
MSRYSVHTGPKGGTEYRQWTGEHTFRTVSRYVAWPHLSDDDRAKAERMEAERKASKASKAATDAAWRTIMYR